MLLAVSDDSSSAISDGFQYGTRRLFAGGLSALYASAVAIFSSLLMCAMFVKAL